MMKTWQKTNRVPVPSYNSKGEMQQKWWRDGEYDYIRTSHGRLLRCKVGQTDHWEEEVDLSAAYREDAARNRQEAERG